MESKEERERGDRERAFCWRQTETRGDTIRDRGTREEELIKERDTTTEKPTTASKSKEID